MEKEDLNKKLKGFIYKQQMSQFNRCLAPFHECSKKVIKAHSIQNNKILKKMSVDGHVIMLSIKQNLDIGPTMNFKNIGKNQATTFTGLCAEHDNEIFQLIDDNEFDFTEPKHLFLLAYRSVLKELHSKMKAAVDISKVCSEAFRLQLPNNQNTDLINKIVITKLAESYSFYRFKHYFDCIYKQKDYEQIKHEVIEIKHKNSIIAVSSIYSPLNYLSTLETRLFPPIIVLNVFPQESSTFVLFSYFKEHTTKIGHYIDVITAAKSGYKNYLISKVILSNCENFILSPAHYETFDENKKTAIKEFFVKTILSDDKSDDPKLCLF